MSVDDRGLAARKTLGSSALRPACHQDEMSDCRAARVLYACLRRFIHGDSNNLALSTRKHAYALVVTYQILGAHRATSTSRDGIASAKVNAHRRLRA